MLYTVYDPSTGAILRSGDCSSAESAQSQAGEGEAVLLGAAGQDDCQRVENGALVDFTPELTRAELTAGIVAERKRRLSLGFDHDFGGSRGIHRIGTTEADLRGWDEVTQFAAALVAAGQGAQSIPVVTDTGPVNVTADEWQQVLIAAGTFRQPIWMASFALQAMDPIPTDYAADEWWLSN